MDEPSVEYAIVCEPSGRLHVIIDGADADLAVHTSAHLECTGHLITYREIPSGQAVTRHLSTHGARRTG